MTLMEFLKGIADAIRSKDETTASIPASDMADRIKAIETGVDTTDATATADDIAKGKTAYVNEEKIEGNVLAWESTVTVSMGADKAFYYTGDSSIKMLAQFTRAMLFRIGSKLELILPADGFGTATEADVKAGKTFTGASGVNLVGTGAVGSWSANLQNKTATPSKTQQVVASDSGYDALGTVTIDPIPGTFLETGEPVAELEMMKANQAGVYSSDLFTMEAYPGGLKAVNAATLVRIKGKLSDFGNAYQHQVMIGSTFTSAEGLKLMGTMPVNGTQTLVITTADQIVKIAEGHHDGFGTVRIADAEVAKIISENIAEGVTILGVEGAHKSGASFKLDNLDYLFYNGARGLQWAELMALVEKPISASAWMYGCTDWAGIDFSAVDWSECKSIASFCRKNTSLLMANLSECDFSKVENAFAAFDGCSNLHTITGIALPNATNITNVFPHTIESGTPQALKNLTFRTDVVGIAGSFSLAYCSFERSGIVAMFNTLPEGSGTITLTGNPGVADLTDEDKALATSKGWTLAL